MDEYHYAADPKLIYKIASEGGKSLDWMADCGVRWRLGEVPVYVAPKNATLDPVSYTHLDVYKRQS